MGAIFIPTEEDIKIWVKDALAEYFAKNPINVAVCEQLAGEDFLNRKQIAAMLGISLVTLHEWMRSGLPFHKKGRRVLFLRSEVVNYVVAKKGGEGEGQPATVITHPAGLQRVA